LKVREYDSIYDNDFDRQLKNMISKEQFRSLMKQVEAMFGSVKRYKKMQWGFYIKELDGKKILHSVKIVEFEKGMAKILFQFNNDGLYQKPIGFYIKERKGVSPPGEF